MKIAFLGLGVMGFPMAGHLAQKSGADIVVFNRTPKKSAEWAKEFSPHKCAPSIREAVSDADLVFACVGDDPDLKQVVLGIDGAFAYMKKGAVLVDHTTASATIAREIAEAADKKSLGFIDAPVSGGQAGAQAGLLTIMCGGDAVSFQKAKPAMMCYARACELIGGSGCGQLAKMVNQICIAGLVQALAEGIKFGKNAGLDMEMVLNVISKGAASSWQMENRGKTMVAGSFDFGFALDWMRKDLRICLEEGRHNGSQLPVTALVDQFYAELQAQGKGRMDTSSLIARL